MPFAHLKTVVPGVPPELLFTTKILEFFAWRTSIKFLLKTGRAGTGKGSINLNRLMVKQMLYCFFLIVPVRYKLTLRIKQTRL